jgi:hypothetical protein
MNTQVDDDAKLSSVSTPACTGLDIKFKIFKRTSNRKRAQKNKKGALRGTCTGVNEQGQKRERKNKKTGGDQILCR